MAYKKKDVTNITLDIIIKKVAQQTGLTIDQVRTALNGYGKVVVETIMLNTCPDNLTISFPIIGKFIFKNKSGLKAGSTYTKPVLFGAVKKGDKIEIETVVVEEDRPDYVRLWFETAPTIQKNLREASEKRNLKKMKNVK